MDWISGKNAEKARITGVEFSFNSIGSIGPVEIISLIGYTYMNPVSLNSDSSYLSQFSDTTSNMLKYRLDILAKADIEFNYKKISLGFSSRYEVVLCQTLTECLKKMLLELKFYPD